MPSPDFSRHLTLDDESASKSNHGLIHLFKLPKIGDYLWNFRIGSYQSPNAITDYITSIHLCVGSPENTVAWARNMCPPTSPDSMHCDNLPSTFTSADIPFFGAMPLLGAGLEHDDVYIGIRFHKIPPSKYFINYEVGFLSDQTVINRINAGHIRCETAVLQGYAYEMRVFNYYGGRLVI